MRRLLNGRRFALAFSKWSEGDGGFDWKSRDLDERRLVAMDAIVNVGKRQLITDSVRNRAKMNVDRLRSSVSTAPTNSFADDSALVDEVSLLLSEEASLDALKFIPESELKFLREELYGGNAAEDTKTLKNWMKLRSEREDTFSSLPKEERNLWSAWYLRDVQR